MNPALRGDSGYHVVASDNGEMLNGMECDWKDFGIGTIQLSDDKRRCSTGCFLAVETYWVLDFTS